MCLADIVAIISVYGVSIVVAIKIGITIIVDAIDIVVVLNNSTVIVRLVGIVIVVGLIVAL